VELKNISSETVDLFDPKPATNAWSLAGFCDALPCITLPPQGLLILTTTNAAAFRHQFDVPSTVPIWLNTGSVARPQSLKPTRHSSCEMRNSRW